MPYSARNRTRAFRGGGWCDPRCLHQPPFGQLRCARSRQSEEKPRSRMFHHLAYTSAAPEPLCPDRLADLLEVSVRNNTRDGITGVMLYHDQSFFQVLEGERCAVERCYMRILGDTRHVGVLRLWNQPVDERVFSHWAMGYAGPDPLYGYKGPAQDCLTRLLRLAGRSAANEPVALALTRQMYNRFRFGMMRCGGPILT
ncbi:BLUF domain-containing protein [Tabrizicola sp. WMC-M-20]|nr:BLUF domain-containing protein [Tabrizicola sp. WMC-M-20]